MGLVCLPVLASDPSHATRTYIQVEPWVYARVEMLFDPNRWPKPYPMLGLPRRVAVDVIALVVVSIALIV
jgi:hypothetical protein